MKWALCFAIATLLCDAHIVKIQKFPYTRHVRSIVKMVASETNVKSELIVPNKIDPTGKTFNRVKSAKITDGKLVEIEFVDKTIFSYHALWLRDACRDEEHVG